MWPFTKRRSATPDSWPIVRTRPVGKRYGRSLSLLINNWQCHLATVDVYSDGSINAWGFLDLHLFDEKLRKRWVVTAPKADQALSVHNFGATNARDGIWLLSDDDVRRAVRDTIRTLNPEMKDLLDMHGSDTEVREKSRYAKLGLSDPKPFRKGDTAPAELLGSYVPTLHRQNDTYELTQFFVFSDGQCRLGSAGDLVPIDEALSLFESGSLVNYAPRGSRIILTGLGEFTCSSDFGGVIAGERQKEIRELLSTLRGADSCFKLCADALREYEACPSPERKSTLQTAYETVPEHLRCYCGDMDTRDTAIRQILFGNEG